MYLCNVQHCIYKVHLNTGFSSNTEITINRFDIAVFFFFSSAVFKWTQKCIINNIQLQHIIPTQLVHMQAKLFKCTMIGLKSKRVPALLDSTTGTKQTNLPCACVFVWECLCWWGWLMFPHTTNKTTHTYIHAHSNGPSSWWWGKSNTNTPGSTPTVYRIFKKPLTIHYLEESIQECSMCCIFRGKGHGEGQRRGRTRLKPWSVLLFF